MKILMRSLLASAALLIPAASYTYAASQVIIPLTGQIIKDGHNFTVSSTTPLDHAAIYYYSISGTVQAEGSPGFIADLTGTAPVNMLSVLALTAPNLIPYLSGTVADPSQGFPFTECNKLGSGKYLVTSGTLAGYTVYGSTRVKAGISSTGEPYGKVSNVTFGVKVPHLGSIADETDYLQFTNGQIVVQTSPISSGTVPLADLSYETPTGLVGVGVTGTGNVALETPAVVTVKKGHSASITVLLQNAGGATGSFVLKSGTAPEGYKQEFVYKSHNETAKVTGTAGFTTPNLASGSVTTLSWHITNKSATSGTVTGVLTAAPTGSGAQDSVGFSVTP